MLERLYGINAKTKKYAISSICRRAEASDILNGYIGIVAGSGRLNFYGADAGGMLSIQEGSWLKDLPLHLCRDINWLDS